MIPRDRQMATLAQSVRDMFFEVCLPKISKVFLATTGVTYSIFIRELSR